MAIFLLPMNCFENKVDVDIAFLESLFFIIWKTYLIKSFCHLPDLLFSQLPLFHFNFIRSVNVNFLHKHTVNHLSATIRV
jgi:hypothetical protein